VKRNLAIIFLLLVGLGLRAFTRETADAPGNWIRLEIPDTKTRIFWQRTGDRFVSEQSKVVLSLAEVAKMRMELRHTSRGREFFAQEVGLTPDAVRAHRDQILKSCYIDKLPAELEHCLDYETVLKNGRRLAFMDDLGEFAGQGVTLVIDGTPELRVRRRSRFFGFLQPSTLDCGGQSWETCSLSAVDAFTRVVEPGSKEYKMFASARTFWSEDVWINNDGALDASIWGDLAGEYRTYSDLPAFRKRPGYEKLSLTFRILSLWDFNKEGFYCTLAPYKPSSLDQVEWSNTVNEPLTSVLPVYQRCEADMVAHHRWLLNWKSSRSGRAIQLKVEGAEPEKYVLSQWRQAGISGIPEFHLELFDNESRCAEVWLSSGSADSLVPSATDKWHPGISLDPLRNFDEVLVVDASGQPHRKVVGKFP